jgi:hypothetical protein
MRRMCAPLVALLLALAVPGIALAIIVDASPESQTHSYGVQSNWSGTWSGASPFVDKFCFGDSLCETHSEAATSRSWHHTYFPCVTTTYTADLQVYDRNEAANTDYVSATEGGGPNC